MFDKICFIEIIVNLSSYLLCKKNFSNYEKNIFKHLVLLIFLSKLIDGTN